jgi:hypothetical protein
MFIDDTGFKPGTGIAPDAAQRVRRMIPEGMYRDRNGVLHRTRTFDRPMRGGRQAALGTRQGMAGPQQKADILRDVFGFRPIVPEAPVDGPSVPDAIRRFIDGDHSTAAYQGYLQALQQQADERRRWQEQNEPWRAGGRSINAQRAGAIVGSHDDVGGGSPTIGTFPWNDIRGGSRAMPSTAAYQGYLQALQERRDARAGVPGVPPQGAASSSAQRRQPGGDRPGRSF